MREKRMGLREERVKSLDQPVEAVEAVEERRGVEERRKRG